MFRLFVKMVKLNRDVLVEKYGKSLHGQVEIDLRGEKIDSIDGQTFHGLSNLVYLWLNDNEITTIEPGTFRDQANLSRLSLHNNRIQHLTSFDPLPNLTRLSLSHNQIESIDPKALHGLRNIELLSLDHNRLEQIGPSTFAELDRAKIKVVSLFDNPSAFKSYIKGDYFTDKENLSDWEKLVSDASSVRDFDEFLAQFLGLNTFQSL